MSKKKVLWTILLIVVIIAIIVLILVVNKNRVDKNSSTNSNENTDTYNKDVSTSNETVNTKSNETEYKETQLSDGILYSKDGKQYKSDIVIGDNYFDTTINDMLLNPESYMNKNIEIEGMYLETLPYMFVGRYSTSSLCAYCPVGYSYFEYQLKGEIDREFTDEEDWIKIIGRLAKGNDETSNYQDYYYLEVLSLEVMNEKGQAWWWAE